MRRRRASSTRSSCKSTISERYWSHPPLSLLVLLALPAPSAPIGLGSPAVAPSPCGIALGDRLLWDRLLGSPCGIVLRDRLVGSPWGIAYCGIAYCGIAYCGIAPPHLSLCSSCPPSAPIAPSAPSALAQMWTFLIWQADVPFVELDIAEWHNPLRPI